MRSPTQTRWEPPREPRTTRSPKSRSDFAKLLFFMAVLILIAGMLGRPYLVMQRVGKFVDALDQRPPEAIKAEMNYYAGLLDDFNPLVRRAAITAMKAASGKDFGANSALWADWWRENGTTWVYKPTRPQPSPQPAAAP